VLIVVHEVKDIPQIGLQGTSRFNSSGWTLDCLVSDLEQEKWFLGFASEQFSCSRPSPDDNLNIHSPRD